ncbi:sialidase family protein [Singulisphaera sp. Ch08]|uniref:Sialidase family protein n=1 Tax=Singulisphaera sp. Ch08 TaxID=3120278 RepID=A0AAU7C6Y2_9BACT
MGFHAGSGTQVERRTFLGSGLGVLAGGLLGLPGSEAGGAPADQGSLIASIDHRILFPGRREGVAWFHPRACMVPSADQAECLMTLQSVSGSDVFGPVHWTSSTDSGKTWTKPTLIPGLGRKSLGDDWESGVCDVVPEYHPATKSVLAIGHNVYYKAGVLAQPQRQRWPVYVVRSAGGEWSAPRILEWDDPRGNEIYSCGCSQRLMKSDGDVLVPLTYGTKGRADRSVTAVLCSFDGQALKIRKVGNELVNRARRGLLEPSLGFLDGRYYLTIRAEDGRGYVSTSEDGLHWEPQRPWSWEESGEPLEMSTTQQHWLTHSDDLFLVYNRKTEENSKVMRWRAPLFVAKVDRKSLRLIRSTEKVVLPLIPSEDNDPKKVALMGNFHPVAVSPGESWVTVSENLPSNNFRGDTLLARIHWSRPNRIAMATESS